MAEHMRDTVCACNHRYEEHDDGGGACGSNCACPAFDYDAELNAPEAIADRGGEHESACVCALCKMLRAERS